MSFPWIQLEEILNKVVKAYRGHMRRIEMKLQCGIRLKLQAAVFAGIIIITSFDLLCAGQFVFDVVAG